MQEGGIRAIAPSIFEHVPVRIRKRRTVAEALLNKAWIRDISGALGVQAIREYLKLWSLLQNAGCNPSEQDVICWKWDSSGQYSSKSAYRALFLGRVPFQSAPIWKSLAPPRCRFFLWLVALDRCWTADRLRRRGLPHPDRCVLCDQHDESIDHILVGCPESRQLWWWVLRAIGHPECLPVNEPSFYQWLCSSRIRIREHLRRGFDTVVTLVAWTIWKERNGRIFNQQQRTWVDIVKGMAAEATLWRQANQAIPIFRREFGSQNRPRDVHL